ncbi:MAG: glyceraldehyde 3-phosphate dehydrogenase NAD-binding domain-containing protein [Patescibacteria group bacterium]
MATVAINGFGRIGRAFFKLARLHRELNIVAINDLGDPETLAYLLRYDSTYGRFDKPVSVQKSGSQTFLIVDDVAYQLISEKDPAKLPWDDMGVDLVVEATGIFESYEKAKVHIDAGAQRVVLTAPAKDADSDIARTVLMGVNADDLKTCSISSNGSCTTNSAAPLIRILEDGIGIQKAFLSTVHGYTATQSLIDGPVKGGDVRRGRAAAVNIVPSSTGAAIAVTRAVPELADRFDGVALRVPTITGSLSGITFVAKRHTSVTEINELLTTAAQREEWKGIFRVNTDPIVSTDIIGDPHAAIADLTLTNVVDGDLCTVYSWYDNEFGYTNALVKHVRAVAALISR